MQARKHRESKDISGHFERNRNVNNYSVLIPVLGVVRDLVNPICVLHKHLAGMTCFAIDNILVFFLYEVERRAGHVEQVSFTFSIFCGRVNLPTIFFRIVFVILTCTFQLQVVRGFTLNDL